MTINSDAPIGKIAAEYPLATRVFSRHLLDFCCGGGRPLGEVCQERGLSAEDVLKEIHQELETTSDEICWDDAPLGELIDHILVTFHVPLKEELPRLESMAQKVLGAHGEKDPKRFNELFAIVSGLRGELEQHMAKEEEILFPMIKQGDGAMVQGPVEVMEIEHESAGNILRRLRELTDGYKVPAEACNTWRALWHGLFALEADLHQHIHLENNILFPRALGGQ